MRHEAVKAGRVSLHWLKYGAPVTMTAPEMGGFYLFQFVLGGACEIRHRGRTEVVDGGQSYVVRSVRSAGQDLGRATAGS